MDEISAKHRLANQKKFDDYCRVLVALHTEQDSAYADLKKNVIDETRFQRLVVKIKESRLFYTSLIEKCSDTIIESQNRTTQKIIELATNLESLWNSRSTAEKVSFLKKVLSNQVLDGPTVRYELKKPFAVIAEMARKENWRTLVDPFITAHFARAA